MHALGKYRVGMVVDTAASYHATTVRDLFCRYVAGDYGNVQKGNTSYSKIAGIRDMCLKTIIRWIYRVFTILLTLFP